MSTIERAAARLGNVVKGDDARQAKERTEPELKPVDAGQSGSSPSAASAAPTQPADSGSTPAVATSAPVASDPAAPAREEQPNAPTMLVGGGYVRLDLDALAQMGFVVAANVESELATDFRRIKRPLLLAVKKAEGSGARENPANLIVVTSSLPNEGKTFTSLNLAFSIAAEMDRSVLLVDGDVAKSSVTQVLGIDYQVGLTDVLARGGAHVEDAVLKTNVEGLQILPAGPRLPNTDELFASDLMRRLMRQLAQEDARRLVVVDAPPLLARTEAPNLAHLAAHVILVIEADKTPQSNVTEALALLHGCEGVSLVLNKVTRRAADRHAYGYGYGYGYGNRKY